MRRLLFLISILLCALAANAQEHIINNSKMIGVGYQALQDTYLTPEHYSGVEMRYISHTTRHGVDTLTHQQKKWSRTIINEGWISSTTPRSDKGGILAGAYDFVYGAMRSWSITDRLTLSAGGQADITAGFIYNTRGGNNVAQARAAINVGPMAKAQYVWGKYCLTYEAMAPLMGVCFSPNYGQSYYEIFSEHNYDHNVVPTTFIATPSLRHSLTLSIRLKRLNMIVGYVGDYRQQAVNNLKQHIYSHDFVIGLTRRITVKP